MSFTAPDNIPSLKRNFDISFEEETRNVKRRRTDKNGLPPTAEEFAYRKHIEVIDDQLVSHYLTPDLTSNRVITKILNYNNNVKKIDASVLKFDQEFIMTLNRCGGSICSLTLRVDNFSDIEQISLPGLRNLCALTIITKNGPLPPVSQATIARLIQNSAAVANQMDIDTK